MCNSSASPCDCQSRGKLCQHRRHCSVLSTALAQIQQQHPLAQSESDSITFCPCGCFFCFFFFLGLSSSSSSSSEYDWSESSAESSLSAYRSRCFFFFPALRSGSSLPSSCERKKEEDAPPHAHSVSEQNPPTRTAPGRLRGGLSACPLGAARLPLQEIRVHLLPVPAPPLRRPPLPRRGRVPHLRLALPPEQRLVLPLLFLDLLPALLQLALRVEAGHRALHPGHLDVALVDVGREQAVGLAAEAARAAHELPPEVRARLEDAAAVLDGEEVVVRGHVRLGHFEHLADTEEKRTSGANVGRSETGEGKATGAESGVD